MQMKKNKTIAKVLEKEKPYSDKLMEVVLKIHNYKLDNINSSVSPDLYKQNFNKIIAVIDDNDNKVFAEFDEYIYIDNDGVMVEIITEEFLLDKQHILSVVKNEKDLYRKVKLPNSDNIAFTKILSYQELSDMCNMDKVFYIDSHEKYVIKKLVIFYLKCVINTLTVTECEVNYGSDKSFGGRVNGDVTRYFNEAAIKLYRLDETEVGSIEFLYMDAFETIFPHLLSTLRSKIDHMKEVLKDKKFNFISLFINDDNFTIKVGEDFRIYFYHKFIENGGSLFDVINE